MVTTIRRPPSELPATVRRDWEELAARPAWGEAFTPGLAAHLPVPVRRWIERAIPVGTPLWQTMELHLRGTIKLRAWVPFDARWLLAPPDGFVWAATARLGPVPIRGFDRFTRGAGEMRWKLAGIVPVMTAADADTSRSAAGRLASEFFFNPALALSPAVRWEPLDATRALARIDVGGWTHEVTVAVSDEGSVESVSLPRWGDPDRTGHRLVPFGAVSLGERTFDGVRLPARFRAGWWFGEDRWAEGEFIRFGIDQVHRH
jgi:hypothetical protein